MSILKKILFIIPIVLAVTLFMLSGKVAKPPQPATEKQEKATAVKVIAAKPLDAVPIVRGFGKVQPARSWDAVAQVSGPILWTANHLRNGLLISKGTELLRIDQREYKLGLAQIDAQTKALQAKDDTTKASLAIEQRALDLLQNDLARKQQLLKQNSTSQAAVDSSERAMLTAQAKVQSLQSALTLNAAERDVLSQQREIAALNIERTSIKAPFDLRLGTVEISEGQYVNKGQQLFSGDGIAVAEIIAQFPVGAFKPLLSKPETANSPLHMLDSSQPGLSSRHDALVAQVLLRTPKATISWNATVDRMTEAMDPKTRTRGIVLKIDDPYGQATPGQRPPLVRDTAVEVILKGAAKKNKIALPSSAVRKGKVMVIDENKRLRFKEVKIAFSQGNIVVLKSGLAPNDKVIVSDMPVPVEGMLLAPRPDKKLLQRVMAEATGKSLSEGKK